MLEDVIYDTTYTQEVRDLFENIDLDKVPFYDGPVDDYNLDRSKFNYSIMKIPCEKWSSPAIAIRLTPVNSDNNEDQFVLLKQNHMSWRQIERTKDSPRFNIVSFIDGFGQPTQYYEILSKALNKLLKGETVEEPKVSELINTNKEGTRGTKKWKLWVPSEAL